ncbi:hypothetical protein YC2023_024706 [Brassica napus]
MLSLVFSRCVFHLLAATTPTESSSRGRVRLLVASVSDQVQRPNAVRLPVVSSATDLSDQTLAISDLKFWTLEISAVRPKSCD